METKEPNVIASVTVTAKELAALIYLQHVQETQGHNVAVKPPKKHVRVMSSLFLKGLVGRRLPRTSVLLQDFYMYTINEWGEEVLREYISI